MSVKGSVSDFRCAILLPFRAKVRVLVVASAVDNLDRVGQQCSYRIERFNRAFGTSR